LCAVDKGRGLYRPLIKDYATDEANDETRSLGELNRQANEMALETDSHGPVTAFWYSFCTVEAKNEKVE
jgi:hypothetical protein